MPSRTGDKPAVMVVREADGRWWKNTVGLQDGMEQPGAYSGSASTNRLPSPIIALDLNSNRMFAMKNGPFTGVGLL